MCRHMHWHTFVSLTLLGHVAQTSMGKYVVAAACLWSAARTNRGKYANASARTCSPTHWHTFPIIVLGHVAQKILGDKYANARGCTCTQTQWHTFPYLSGPCGPQARRRSGILSPTCLGHVAQPSKGNKSMPMHVAAHCYVIHNRILYFVYAVFQISLATHGPEKIAEIYD